MSVTIIELLKYFLEKKEMSAQTQNKIALFFKITHLSILPYGKVIEFISLKMYLHFLMLHILMPEKRKVSTTNECTNGVCVCMCACEHVVHK